MTLRVPAATGPSIIVSCGPASGVELSEHSHDLPAGGELELELR